MGVNKKINLHIVVPPTGFEPSPHWRALSALITVPSKKRISCTRKHLECSDSFNKMSLMLDLTDTFYHILE